MPYLWNLLYCLAGMAALPWLLWQRVVRGKRRGGWPAKLWGAVTPWPRQSQLNDVAFVNDSASYPPPPATRLPPPASCHLPPTIWFHAVSVGEVNLLAPLLREIAAREPTWRIYLTVTTVAGYELARKKYPNAVLSYAPLDFSWAVRRAIRAIRPDLLVLVELELWPNLIQAAAEFGAKVAVINGRLSARSFGRYRLLRWLVSRTLRRINLIAAQSSEYAERFTALGAAAESVHITGSLKFDGARSDRAVPEVAALRSLAGFTESDIVFVAGSTSEPEEEIVLAACGELWPEFPNLRLVIVPRHPERFNAVARQIAAAGPSWARRNDLRAKVKSQKSEVEMQNAECRMQNDAQLVHQTPNSKLQPPSLQPRASSLIQPFRILLVDTVGELENWWGTASLGFVGGSFMPRGGQSMIEPAAYGVATCFGPQTWNFRETVQLLLAHDAAVVVPDRAGLVAFLRAMLHDPQAAAVLGQRAKTLVAAQQGATERTLQLLSELMRNPNLTQLLPHVSFSATEQLLDKYEDLSSRPNSTT